MDSKTFQIPSMTPEDKQTIENEIGEIGGVRQVLVDQPTHTITVTWTSPATWDDITRRLAELNFSPNYPQAF